HRTYLAREPRQHHVEHQSAIEFLPRRGVLKCAAGGAGRAIATGLRTLLYSRRTPDTATDTGRAAFRCTQGIGTCYFAFTAKGNRMTDYSDYFEEVIQAHVAIEQWFNGTAT